MTELVTRACVDCNTEFSMDEGEQNFYKEKGWVLPKRCKKCRQSKKLKETQQAQAPLPVPAVPAVVPLKPIPERLVLGVRDFEELIRRKEIPWHGFRLILADIGFGVMKRAIEEAELEAFRNGTLSPKAS